MIKNLKAMYKRWYIMLFYVLMKNNIYLSIIGIKILIIYVLIVIFTVTIYSPINTFKPPPIKVNDIVYSTYIYLCLLHFIYVIYKYIFLNQSYFMENNYYILLLLYLFVVSWFTFVFY